MFAARYATPANAKIVIPLLLQSGAEDVAEALKITQERKQNTKKIAEIIESEHNRLQHEVGPTR